MRRKYIHHWPAACSCTRSTLGLACRGLLLHTWHCVHAKTWTLQRCALRRTFPKKLQSWQSPLPQVCTLLDSNYSLARCSRFLRFNCSLSLLCVCKMWLCVSGPAHSRRSEVVQWEVFENSDSCLRKQSLAYLTEFLFLLFTSRDGNAMHDPPCSNNIYCMLVWKWLLMS